MTKEETLDTSVSKTIQNMRTDLFTSTSSNKPDNTNIHHITLTQSFTPLLSTSPSVGTVLPSSSPSSISTSAEPSDGHTGSLLPIIIGSVVGVVGILLGVCIGLLFVNLWLVKRRSLASTGNFGAAYRTC